MSKESNEDWIIPDEVIEAFFRKAKENIQRQNDKIFFDWSRPVVSEITPNVARTLNSKFRGCENNGYSVAKIAGLYTFWIAIHLALS